MKTPRFFFVVGMVVFASCATAQEMGPRPATDIHPSFTTLEKRARAPIDIGGATRIRLPEVFLPKGAVEDSRRATVGHGRMFAAEGIPAPTIAWTKRDRESSATVSIASPGAVGVRVGIRIHKATARAGIVVASTTDLAATHAVHHEQLHGAIGSVLWTAPTAGEEQVVQLIGGEEELAAEIVGVSHIFSGFAPSLAKDVGDSLSCQVDVACVSNSTAIDATTKTAFNAKVNSTALLVITTATGQTATCTGTLLNNDYRVPLLLTAQHCVGQASEANNLATVWSFQAATCGGPAPASLTVRTGGALLYAVRQDLDQSIMALRDSPPSSAVLSGWSAGTSSRTGELMLGMHHPRGDLKKTSLGSITGISGAFSIGTTNYPADHFFLTGWQIGLVESGSSGSGIFIQPAGQDYLALVGVLNSGPASALSCAAATTYTNRYGRLSSFFPLAQKFLQSDYSANYSDLWWNPSESGWGINLQHQGDIVFATWFTYDTNGSGMWLVMSNGERVGTSTYQGTLYRARGTPFNQINGAQAVETPLPAVGTATLNFSGANSGTFSYTVNGVSGTKQIQRQVFSTRPTCEFNLASRGDATNYQDLWWNPDEAGWGVNLTHQGDILFATWFTYDQSRAGMWLVMSNGVRTGPGSYRGDLYRTTGTPFNQINGTQAVNLPLTPIGTLSFSFSDGFTGTMSYTVNGISGSKAIRRQLFAYPNTVCRP